MDLNIRSQSCMTRRTEVSDCLSSRLQICFKPQGPQVPTRSRCLETLPLGLPLSPFAGLFDKQFISCTNVHSFTCRKFSFGYEADEKIYKCHKSHSGSYGGFLGSSGVPYGYRIDWEEGELQLSVNPNIGLVGALPAGHENHNYVEFIY